MKLAVGFITYNTDTAKYLPYFLDSLFKSLESLPRDQFLVLARDNSDDRDNYNYDYIKNVFNKNEVLIDFSWSGGNDGFSKSYNIMISQAKEWGAEAFLIINPDTILAPDSLEKLLAALDEDKMLGSVAPKVLNWDFTNQKLTKVIDTCGLTLRPGLIFTDIGQGLIDANQFLNLSILGPSGAAGLYRMTALSKVKEKTGYLDERMFMYKEDCDLAYRLFLLGFSSKLVSEALVYHDRSVSAKGGSLFSVLRNRREKSKQVKSWSFLNQHLLMIKFWSKQDKFSKLKIIIRGLSFSVYALIFEPFLLKNYLKIRKYLREQIKDRKAIDQSKIL